MQHGVSGDDGGACLDLQRHGGCCLLLVPVFNRWLSWQWVRMLRLTLLLTLALWKSWPTLPLLHRLLPLLFACAMLPPQWRQPVRAWLHNQAPIL